MENKLDYFKDKPNKENLEKQRDINIEKAISELLKGEWLLENNEKIIRASNKNNSETFIDKENIEKLVIAELKRLIREDHNIDLGTPESEELDREYPEDVILEKLEKRIGNIVDLFQRPEKYIDKGF